MQTLIKLTAAALNLALVAGLLWIVAGAQLATVWAELGQ
jgi:hypothetical protein